MDPRIKTLIEGVRQTHTPIWWVVKELSLAGPDDPWCTGCKGVLIPHRKCPVIAAADELEAEDDSTESDSD